MRDTSTSSSTRIGSRQPPSRPSSTTRRRGTFSQGVAAASGLLLALLVLGLARELWPARRSLHLIALGVVVFSPAAVRASVMYHPETLAAALAALGLLCTARSLRPGSATVAPAIGAGAAFGLGVLTRSWVWPIALGALLVMVVAALRGARGGWRGVGALAVLVAVLSAPWLVRQELEYGSPFAFNREAASTLGSRPAAFFFAPHALDVFDRPVPERLRNELVPQVYADWWGDFFLTWDVDERLLRDPWLPDPVVDDRARQSFLGLLPSILALAGTLAIGFLAVRRRDIGLALVPVPLAALGLAFLWFQLRYPVPDADTIKGTYVLCALPGLALGAAFAADTLARSSRLAAVLLGAVTVTLVVLEVPFLVL
jgi:hypothetical protein